jgi:predicted ATPase/DNA-binding CsgD family transcriptional regulator
MSDSVSSSLPHPFTSLIGRERDIESIASLLRASAGSMVTLVGPAGVGKTRLAIAVAEKLAAEFEQGAVYVDLAPVTDPAQVVPAVAHALEIPDAALAAGQLAQFLSDRSLLLVLDNFEQVVDTGPFINSCLAGAPGVRALVTSQTSLRVRGEKEYAVEPLPLPPALPPFQLEQNGLARYRDNPSVRLFVNRAQSVRSGFQLTELNLPAVIAICRYLDGIPLAIELAAARSNVLSPEALLRRLTSSLQLLNNGPRDAPHRHRALHAAIEWSYGLLDPREARLLDRLSVFSGSFSLPAVEAIAANAPITFAPSFYVGQDPQLPPDDGLLEWTDVFDLLDALASHSLVQRVETTGDDARFRLFQTIRQLGADRLAERGETERIALRHATWFRALAESAWGPDGVAQLEGKWLAALDADSENLRSALDFLSERDPAMASTMAAALLWYFYIRGRRLEGIGAIERVYNRFDPALLTPATRARTTFALGSLQALYPDTRHQGVALLESVVDDLRATGNDWGVGYALMALAVLAEDDGDYERALDFIAQSRPLLDAVDDPATLANVDFHTAVSLFGLGKVAEARALAATVAFATPDSVGLNIAYALHLVGMIDLAEGRSRDAARSFGASADFSEQHGIIATAAELLDATATLQESRGDAELVARLFGAADRLNRESGNPITYPERIYYDAARDRARQSLGSARFQELLAAGAALPPAAAFALMRQTLDAFEDADGAATLPPPLPVIGAAQPYGLTNRELDVLRLVATGMSDREIADLLYISHGTARTHVRNILGKMEAPNRSAATSIALRERLVDLSEAG